MYKRTLLLIIASGLSISFLPVFNISFPLFKNSSRKITIAAFTIPLIAASYYLFQKNKPVLMRTHAGFHISRYYNKLRYGSDFTFDRIAGDFCQQNKTNSLDIIVEYDDAGEIKALNDCKKTPLILGSIPSSRSHIESILHKYFNNNQQLDQTKLINIITLNEPWECEAAGLTDLVKNNSQIVQVNLPTLDYEAPSFIDLLRGVRDLRDRDNFNYHFTLVHCKAGRGRSASVIAAYLLSALHEANRKPTIQQVENYLKKCRPQVSLNIQHKAALSQYINKLEKACSFANLYKLNQEEVEKRDQEIIYLSNSVAAVR